MTERRVALIAFVLTVVLPAVAAVALGLVAHRAGR